MLGHVVDHCMGLRFPTAWTGLALLLVPMGAAAIDRQEVLEQMKNSRPADLTVLIETPDAGGLRTIGIYAIKPSAADPKVRQYKIWEELPNDLNIYFESVNCSVTAPLRVKRTSTAVYVRNLNPGGPVSDTNREDHLVWWAACVPEVAGTEPASLRQKALDLGYSTLIPERQQQLPALAPKSPRP